MKDPILRPKVLLGDETSAVGGPIAESDLFASSL